MKCSKCGGRRVDVRPNWKEASPVHGLARAVGWRRLMAKWRVEDSVYSNPDGGRAEDYE